MSVSHPTFGAADSRGLDGLEPARGPGRGHDHRNRPAQRDREERRDEVLGFAWPGVEPDPDQRGGDEEKARADRETKGIAPGEQGSGSEDDQGEARGLGFSRSQAARSETVTAEADDRSGRSQETFRWPTDPGPTRDDVAAQPDRNQPDR